MARNRTVNVIQPDGRASVWALTKPQTRRGSGTGPDRELFKGLAEFHQVCDGRTWGRCRAWTGDARSDQRRGGCRSEHRGAIVAMNSGNAEGAKGARELDT